MRKVLGSVILSFLFVFGLMPISTVSAGGVSPTPWFTIIGAWVTVAGEPAAVGTGVEFYCRENLAGYGETYDYSALERGILGLTHVYGSDLEANPQILACEEGDLIEVRVNGVRAVMSPQMHWTNDWDTHLVSIDLDSQVYVGWEADEAIVSIGMFEEPVGLRSWSDWVGYFDYSITTFPFTVSYPPSLMKAFSLTNGLDKTKVYVGRDQDFCPTGPNYTISEGGDSIIIEFENTTPEVIQMVLRLGETVSSAGILPPWGGFQIQTDSLYGAVEARIGTELGPRCAILEWDYRLIPSPRIVNVDWGNSSVYLSGDNFFPNLSAGFDPATFLVDISGGNTNESYSMLDIWAMGGIWQGRTIQFPLAEGLPSGEYQVTVTLYGQTSNSGTILVPYRVYLPSVLK